MLALAVASISPRKAHHPRDNISQTPTTAIDRILPVASVASSSPPRRDWRCPRNSRAYPTLTLAASLMVCPRLLLTSLKRSSVWTGPIVNNGVIQPGEAIRRIHDRSALQIRDAKYLDGVDKGHTCP